MSITSFSHINSLLLINYKMAGQLYIAVFCTFYNLHIHSFVCMNLSNA